MSRSWIVRGSLSYNLTLVLNSTICVSHLFFQRKLLLLRRLRLTTPSVLNRVKVKLDRLLGRLWHLFNFSTNRWLLLVLFVLLVSSIKVLL